MSEHRAVIESLDVEQLAALNEFRRRWSLLIKEPGTEREEIFAAVRTVYESSKVPTPPIFWCESPWQVMASQCLLLLLGLAAGNPELIGLLARDFAVDPKWSRLWSSLQSQQDALHRFIAGVTQKNDGAKSAGEYLGLDLFQFVLLHEPDKAVLDNLSAQLGIRVQLKLRDLLDSRNREMQQGNILRTAFGLLLSSFVPGGTGAEFRKQLNADTLELVDNICQQHLLDGRGAPLGALGRGQNPITDELSALSTQHANLFRRHWSDWLPTCGFVLNHLPVSIADPSLTTYVNAWLTLKENLFDIYSFANVCFVCQQPTTVAFDENRRLHSRTGPALEFVDGSKLYACDGVVMAPSFVENPEGLSIEEIDAENNAEVRRILIQQYGIERYLKDSNAQLIDYDTEFGLLYKKVLKQDEPIVVVRVINPTPEPDGSKKHYFLRVPPYIMTAREAVAWTFGMKKEEYEPASQT